MSADTVRVSDERLRDIAAVGATWWMPSPDGPLSVKTEAAYIAEELLAARDRIARAVAYHDENSTHSAMRQGSCSDCRLRAILKGDADV